MSNLTSELMRSRHSFNRRRNSCISRRDSIDMRPKSTINRRNSSTMHSKELTVKLNGHPSAFLFHLNTAYQQRGTRVEKFHLFLERCSREFRRKIKFLYTSEGKILRSLMEIPFDCDTVIASASLGLRPIVYDSQISSVIESSSLVRKKPPPRPRKIFDLRNKDCINRLKQKFSRTSAQIDFDFPKMPSHQARTLAKKYSFEESEIYKLYGQYKTMLLMSCVNSENYNIGQGVLKSAFIETLTTGNEKASVLVGRIFDSLDFNHDGFIQWEEYLRGMRIILFGSPEEKIDLIFKVYDTNNNGTLNYKEIRELCTLQLYFANDDHIMQYLSKSFTDLIFKLTKVPLDGQVTRHHLKELLQNESEKELISMFYSFSFINTTDNID